MFYDAGTNQALMIVSGEVASASENAFREAKAATKNAGTLILVMAYLLIFDFKAGGGCSIVLRTRYALADRFPNTSLAFMLCRNA